MNSITQPKITKVISENIKSYPIINEFLSKSIIGLIRNTPDIQKLLEISLVRMLYTDGGGIKNFEQQLNEVSQYAGIERPLRRLSKNIKEEFLSIWSEIWTAKELHELGAENIRFAPNGARFDLSYSLDGAQRFAEVKDFQTIDPAMDYLAQKFEARSILDERLRRLLIVSCRYPEYVRDVADFHRRLTMATDRLMTYVISQSDIDKLKIPEIDIDGFVFRFEVGKTKKAVYRTKKLYDSLKYIQPLRILLFRLNFCFYK